MKSEGYIVISTFQWNESYDHQPHILQGMDFQFMADAGADIVSGSQAHYAQKMEFYKHRASATVAHRGALVAA